MASKSGGPLLAFIRRIAALHRHADLTDGELLQRFAGQRDESAFTALMHRHGPMVLGVCQSILDDVHDAEDVFQATFLVLVRKSNAVTKPASVASWLHGVAYRLAMKARVEVARRRVHERQAVAMSKPTWSPQEEVIWRDLRPVLHQEVQRLPERYRLPFVLCYLEGKTNEEAATLLGWPKGTVLSSLARARERLRHRLTRRGLALTSGLLGAVPAQNAASAAVPAVLAENTLKAALLFAASPGAVSGIAAPVLAYAESMLHAAFVAKLKVTAVLLLATAAAGTGAVLLVYGVRTAIPAEVVSRNPPPAPKHDETSPMQPPQQLMEERSRIQGQWIITAAQQHGRAIDVLNGRRLVFREDRFMLSAGHGEVSGIIPTAAMEGDFTLELTRPRQIDFNRRSWYLRGIYQLEGKDLQICLDKANQGDRPVGFTTTPTTGQLLLILARQ
jgi:RNA polymerase sigma factor (sigma-70 family)